jgi:hypothetical protein
MGIGALFIPRHFAHTFQNQIKEIKKRHSMDLLEIKWRKVSKKTLDLYKELVDFCIDNKMIQLHDLKRV